MSDSSSRWWGGDRALLDDDEARRRILEAAAHCVVDRGHTQIRMADVADRAGVSRSTLYRYFASRDQLLLGLVLARTDHALESVVSRLAQPRDAARSIPDLILKPLALVAGNPLNQALFAAPSVALNSALYAGPAEVLDVLFRHFGPLLQQWQDDGQIHTDLDLRQTVRWMMTMSLFLLGPDWQNRSVAAKRKFVERYLSRALLVS